MMEFDVVVIGAGPGGYVASIRAAQLGKKVLLIENRTRLGGECLNWGCIPSKALVNAADLYHDALNAEHLGIHVEKISIDIKKLIQWKEQVVETLTQGIWTLCEGNNVNILLGEASFETAEVIKVKKHDGEEVKIKAENIILAPGTSFIELPNLRFDHPRVFNAKSIFEIDYVPKHLVVVGGGVIGLELGTIFRKLGSKVTVVELLDQILPGIEKSLVQVLRRSLIKDLGFDLYVKSKATKIEHKENESIVFVESPKGEIQLEADAVLVSIGKRANKPDILGLAKIDVEVDERGFIKVDSQLRTSINHIFAIGDCTGAPFLAHRASHQGVIAAENIAGKFARFDPHTIPLAIFTDPEIASVGISEDEAKKQGIEVIKARIPFATIGRAVANGSTQGFAKIIARKDDETIIGAQIVGPDACDLISEMALAVEHGMPIRALVETIHPHPTLSEILPEVALAGLQRSIHFLKTNLGKD